MKSYFVALFFLFACPIAGAASPVPASYSGYAEYSLYDFSAEELEDIGKAMRARGMAARQGKVFVAPSRATAAQVEAKIAEIQRFQNQPANVPNADLLTELAHLKNRPKTSDPYLLKPPVLAITSSCKVLSTRQGGSKRKDGYTGYARYFKCADGDVYVWEMLLIGVRLSSIKEYANVDLNGVRGRMTVAEDSLGTRVYRLTWVSNNTHHNVSKQGHGPEVAAWLQRYADEVIAAERAR